MSAPANLDVRTWIRSVPDFRGPGIVFRDVATPFGDPRGLRLTVDRLVHPLAERPIRHAAAPEARGFIPGGAVAALKFALGRISSQALSQAGRLRKPGIGLKCALEYGEAAQEVYDDALARGEELLIVGDPLVAGAPRKPRCGRSSGWAGMFRGRGPRGGAAGAGRAQAAGGDRRGGPRALRLCRALIPLRQGRDFPVPAARGRGRRAGISDGATANAVSRGGGGGLYPLLSAAA